MTSNPIVMTVTPPNSIKLVKIESFSIYPNPNDGNFYISYPNLSNTSKFFNLQPEWVSSIPIRYYKSSH